jgi:hypothetical protein
MPIAIRSGTKGVIRMSQNARAYPPTQDHILARDVRDNVIVLRSGDMAALIEVEGLDFSRLSDEGQRAMVVQFEQFLLTMRFPYQIVVARKRQRLEEYLAYVQEEATKRRQEGNAPYAKGLYGFIQFMQEVSQQINAQAPQYLIVVPYDPIPPDDRTQRKLVVTQDRYERGITELAHRTEAVVRGLTRIGLGSRRLTDQEIIAVLYRVYHPSVPDYRVPPTIRLRSVIAQLQETVEPAPLQVHVPRQFTGAQ